MQNLIAAIGKDPDNVLTGIYVGYDFASAQAALVQAAPFIGFIFEQSFAPAVTIRSAGAATTT